jgi:hypothetical protein
MFEANIMHKNEKVSTVNGSYCGYAEIDGNRYWDIRYTLPFKVVFYMKDYTTVHWAVI